MLKTLLIGLVSIVSCVITAWADPLPPSPNQLRFDGAVFAAAPAMLAMASQDDAATADDDSRSAQTPRLVRTHVSDVATWNDTKPCVPTPLSL